jgi:hypothetical protein
MSEQYGPYQFPSAEKEARELFPAAFAPIVRTERPNQGHHLEGHRTGPKYVRPLSTRTRAILSLELRGHDKQAIAAMLNLAPRSVWRITNTARYLAKRDEVLDRMDADFVGMKPLAFQALRGALTSRDENTALRASEQWMKAAGFMQYGRSTGQQGVTAEDVAARLLNVTNVTVNVSSSAEGRGEPFAVPHTSE